MCVQYIIIVCECVCVVWRTALSAVSGVCAAPSGWIMAQWLWSAAVAHCAALLGTGAELIELTGGERRGTLNTHTLDTLTHTHDTNTHSAHIHPHTHTKHTDTHTTIHTYSHTKHTHTRTHTHTQM